MPAPRPDLFISADVETDGPIPGEFSILSFAFSLAGAFDGRSFVRVEPSEETTLYLELKPISDRFEAAALNVNGMDREALAREGLDPTDAMQKAASWVDERAEGARPVLVAYPVAFDWSFLYWYFVRFTGDSPFGFSSCLDIRTLFQARALTTFDDASRNVMPPELRSPRAHTHHAVDDAWEQGELFANIFTWALAEQRRSSSDADRDRPPHWLEPLVDPMSQRSHGGSSMGVIDRLLHAGRHRSD